MELPEGFQCEFEGLADGLREAPSVSVRCNLRKRVGVPEGAARVPWCPSGFYLDARVPFTFDPALHQGLYYVQDASSMIYDYIVRLMASDGLPKSYLDACAAPGGKTTAAIDALPDGSVVVANEYVRARAEVLRENIVKWGYDRVYVSCGDTRAFRKLKEEFDIVAADVPCSGEGMFRKDPEAVAQWTPALVAECALRQREIVDNLWPALRSGGCMIYSTCTFNRAENEDIVRYIMDEYGAEPVELPVPDEWNILRREGCMHFLPGRVRGEGLTVAVLRKPGECPVRGEKPEKKRQEKMLPAIASCRKYLGRPDEYAWAVEDDTVLAIPDRRMYARLAKVLDLRLKGIEVATIKGRDVIPAQSLAMSCALVDDAFPSYEVDYGTAVSYLRREAVTLVDAPQGYVLLTYRKRPLGFVKNLGRRANNLYPQSWRILSTHTPDMPPEVLR